MHIEQRPLTDIQPYENNPRLNNDAVDAVAKSIQEFGFRQPIVVDEQGVIIVRPHPLQGRAETGPGDSPRPRGHGAHARADQSLPPRRQQDRRTGRLGSGTCCRPNCWTFRKSTSTWT